MSIGTATTRKIGVTNLSRTKHWNRISLGITRTFGNMWVLCTWILVFYSSLCYSQTPVPVNTNVGSIIGYQENINIDGEQKLISKFLGIPYGESTAGQNRFQKPVPKAYFQGTFDARNTPMACFQQSKAEVDLYKDTYAVPGFSEDCLTLNIYVPHNLKSSVLLPVMVWIYGGGFTQGAASTYNPEILSIFGNVIVVTINYRIGMFGFLRDSIGNFPGNQGLWDQHLAIKWVHENIESFLGYKDEITIFGESAGGASVLFQAVYPGNKGLFKRVIAESGTAVAQWAIKDVSNFEKYLVEMGCSPNSNTTVACMLAKDPMSLLSNSTTFGPVVDGEFLMRTPHAMLQDPSAETADARDFFASLDIIVGVNDMDGAVYFGVWLGLLGHKDLEFNISRNEFREHIVPFIVNSTLTAKDDAVTREALKALLTFYYTNWEDPDDYISIRNNAICIANDATFFAPAIQTARLHAMLQRGNTFFYEFALQNGTHFIDVPSWVKGQFYMLSNLYDIE